MRLAMLVLALVVLPRMPYPPIPGYLDNLTVDPVWDRLAECESDGRWDYDGLHKGGLQFTPETWQAFAPPGFPESASEASARQEIVVAERVLEVQGPGAWPTCGPMVGLGGGA